VFAGMTTPKDMKKPPHWISGRLFPTGRLFPIAFASLIAVYAAIFSLFVEEIFRGINAAFLVQNEEPGLCRARRRNQGLAFGAKLGPMRASPVRRIYHCQSRLRR
jgi:hypothetical protein